MVFSQTFFYYLYVMSEIIDVNTGEVIIGNQEHILTCRALGSCIAVVLIDKKKNMGGIAHIMLAGKAPVKSRYPYRYAENALNYLFQELNRNGASGDFIACIAGAGNVLKRKNDTIYSSNKISVKSILNHYHIPIVSESVGGFERRSIKYHISKKKVTFTISDSEEMTMFKMSA